MEMQVLAGSPRLLRNLNEKAVLERLLSEGSLTRMELEAFTGLSKPAMSDLLRRLESAGLIRRDGEKAGTYGPKAGLWTLRADAAFVAGVDVTSHGIDVAISDITGQLVATLTEHHAPGERYDAGDRLLHVLEAAVKDAELTIKDLDQVVLGLPGIVDSQTGHLRKGRQLPNWEGFDIPTALMEALGHRRVMIDNDVNLVALEEMSVGASVGVHSMVLFWIGEGIGGALVQGGKLVRGSTGSAGELGGVLISEAPVAPGGTAAFGFLEELLSEAGIAKVVAAHEIPGASVIEAVRNATQAAQKHEQFLTILGHRIATGIAGAIGILDPDMVVLAGEIGQAGGRVLAQHVTARLKTLPIAIPQIVPTAVSEHAVRAGAIELALEQTRERVFTGGSAARGLP